MHVCVCVCVCIYIQVVFCFGSTCSNPSSIFTHDCLIHLQVMQMTLSSSIIGERNNKREHGNYFSQLLSTLLRLVREVVTREDFIDFRQLKGIMLGFLIFRDKMLVLFILGYIHEFGLTENGREGKGLQGLHLVHELYFLEGKGMWRF